MKNQEIGYVIEIETNTAKVKVGRHSDCKNCGGCPGNNSLILNVQNPLGAKVGQKVIFESKKNKMLSSVYVVYIQPILLTFIGIILGYFIATYIHKSIQTYEIILGSIFFILSLIYIRFIELKAKKDKDNIPTITKILS